MSSTPDSPDKGWYPDPAGPGKLRWWDGEQWTQRVQDAPPEPEAIVEPKDEPAARPAPPAPVRAPTPAPAAKKPWYQRPLPLIGLGLVALIVIASIAGSGSKKSSGSGDGASTATQATTPTATTTAAAPPAPAPAPEPDPEVTVTVSGPSVAHRDNVVLRGTVDPVSSHVRVRGHSARVRNGHWKVPVRLSRHGDNSFSVLATRKGYTEATDTAIITRKLSAAERAAARQRRARYRANQRALQSAEDYLDTSSFSKQGLFEQLSSAAGEGFTQSEAQYAVDHVDADWKQEAVESARSYLQTSSFSRSALIEQLTSSAGEGFTYEQAIYAVNKVY